MAIYHAHLKSISRADGRSATGSIAYRAACKVVDERTGIEFDYSRKKGVEHTQIFFPPGEDDSRPDLHDTSALWNEVEKKETKSNAQVARDFEFSFPHELDAEQRQQMLSMFCQWLTKNHGVVAQGCIHAPHGKDADDRNYHAHILFSTRRFENGQLTEKTREFSKRPYDDKELAKYMAKGGKDYTKRLHHRSSATELLREAYEVIGNKFLIDAGFEPTLDRRSYAERGIDQEPTIHEGAGREMSKRGLQSDTHDKNVETKERNQKLSELHNEIQASSSLLSRLDVEYRDLVDLQTQIQQQFFNNAQMQKRADKVLDMCLHPENFPESSLCCELVDQKHDLNNRFNRQEQVREAIGEIVLDIINDEIGKIDLAVVEKHELQAFTDYLRKELGDYSKDELLITYKIENSTEKALQEILREGHKPLSHDYNSPEP